MKILLPLLLAYFLGTSCEHRMGHGEPAGTGKPDAIPGSSEEARSKPPEESPQQVPQKVRAQLSKKALAQIPERTSVEPEAAEMEPSGEAWASAIAAGDVEAVLRLIFAGMNANTPANGHPPCVAAVRADAAAVLEQIIKAGADPNAVDPGNITPLYLAARDGKRECARVLLEAKKVLSVESDRGWPVKSVTPAADRHLVDDANGHTALMAAIVNRQPNDFIGFLLDHGLDASRSGTDGLFPLWIAAERNNLELADLLLKKRAHRNVLAPTGQTALSRAAQLGHTEMVEFLIGQGVDLARRDHEQRTALGWARRNGHTAAARALEGAGAPE